MSHFPSSQKAPHPPTPEQLERAGEIRRKAAEDNWEYCKKLILSGDYPYRADKECYACPECYAQVGFYSLFDHEDWHKRQRVQSIIGPGLI